MELLQVNIIYLSPLRINFHRFPKTRDFDKDGINGRDGGAGLCLSEIIYAASRKNI